MAIMKPGMSPCFTVISLVAMFLPTTSPCSGYFLVRLQPTDTVSKSMTDVSTNRDFLSLILRVLSVALWPWRSIVEPIAKFDKNFARVIPVETSEGGAVVEFDAAVGDVQRVQRGGDALAEILAQRQIEGGVSGEIAAGIGLVRERVAETRAVVDVGGSKRAPGERDVRADVK